MSFYLDKNGCRKSPIALAAFGAAILDWVVYLTAASLLAEPLYRWIQLENEAVMALAHALAVSVVSTAVGCTLFLLKDKRVVPYGFAVAAGLFAVAMAAVWTREAGQTLGTIMLLFGVPPLVLGNIVSWWVYRKLGVKTPAPKPLAQEICEAMETAPDSAAVTPQESSSPATAWEKPKAPLSPQEEAAALYEEQESI